MHRLQEKHEGRLDEPANLWEALGIPAPDFAEDQSKAPPVDQKLLWSFVRQELSGTELRNVCELLVRFRSWDEAYDQMRREYWASKRA